MKDKGSDLKKKLLESLPDEMDDELFRQLQSEISKTVNEYDDSGSDRVYENEDSNAINDNDSAGVTAGAGSKEPDGIFDDPDGSEFSYDRIMSEMADVEMPPELEERLRRINEDYIAACEAKAELENRKQKRARSVKRIRSAAAVIAVFAVISGGVIWKAPQAEAFRLKLYDTVFSPTHEDVGVEFVDTVYNNMPVIEDETLKAKANEIIERDGFILYPSVLPDGYEVSGIEFGKKNRIVFEDVKNNEIDFSYYSNLDMTFYNDSDNSNNVEVLVNGQSAVLREDNQKKELYWEYDKSQMRLITFDKSVSAASLIKIGDNIKKFYKIS
ncbi:MAG: hypothetical protein SPJ45_04040 [Anaerovoracaceae bacterium]|nr:hypothetical protein [Anaerovoracaceae bacterium]